MARQFNGTNQSLQSAATLDLTAFGQLAVQAWFYWDAFANDDDLLLDFGAGNSSGGFTIDPNGSGGLFNLGTYDAAGANNNRFEFTRPSAGAWHHFVANIDRPVAGGAENAWRNVWIDHVAQSPSTGIPGSLTNDVFGNLTLNVMSRTNATLFGAGRVAEISIWGGVQLTQQNVDDLWNSGLGANASTVQGGSQVFYWDVCGASSPEPAEVGGTALTVNGATFVAHPVGGLCAGASGGGRYYGIFGS